MPNFLMLWKWFDLQPVVDALFDDAWISVGLSGAYHEDHDGTAQLARN